MARPLRRIPPALAVLALAAAAPAFAQGVVSEKALSLGLAQAASVLNQHLAFRSSRQT